MIAVCGNCKTKLKLEVPETFTGNIVKFKCTQCGKLNQVDLLQSENLMPEPENSVHGTSPGWLVVHDENAPVQTFELRIGRNTIGRSSDKKPADIMIDTSDAYMSRCHFTIEVMKTAVGKYEYLISDNKSLNGTFLNSDKGKRLKESDQFFLNDGDTIQAGRTKIVLKTSEKSTSKKQAEKTVVQSDYAKTIII